MPEGSVPDGVPTARQVEALREKLTTLHLKLPEVSAKMVHDLLKEEDEAGEWAWVSLGRVKKQLAKLGRQKKEGGDGGIDVQGLSSLPGCPANELMADRFSKEMFNVSEKFRSHRDNFSGMDDLAPLGPGFGVRETVHVLLTRSEEGAVAGRGLAFQDDAETKAIMLLVSGVRKASNGWPIFMLHYACHTRNLMTPVDYQLLQWFASRTNGILKFKCDLEEQKLWEELLGRNADRLRDETDVMGDVATKPMHPKMRPTFLDVYGDCKPLLEEASRPVKVSLQCSKCGVTVVKLNYCSHCRGVGYCGRACQKADWKQHKLVCAKDGAGKGEEAEAGVVILPVVAPEDLTPEEFRGKYLATLGVSGFSKTRHSSKVSNNVHGANRFIVKIQLPMVGSNAPLLLYDQHKTLQRYIMPGEQPAYVYITAMVQNKGCRGIKAYFWARRVAANIHIDVDRELPSQTQAW